MWTLYPTKHSLVRKGSGFINEYLTERYFWKKKNQKYFIAFPPWSRNKFSSSSKLYGQEATGETSENSTSSHPCLARVKPHRSARSYHQKTTLSKPRLLKLKSLCWCPTTLQTDKTRQWAPFYTQEHSGPRLSQRTECPTSARTGGFPVPEHTFSIRYFLTQGSTSRLARTRLTLQITLTFSYCDFISQDLFIQITTYSLSAIHHDYTVEALSCYCFQYYYILHWLGEWETQEQLERKLCSIHCNYIQNLIII